MENAINHLSTLLHTVAKQPVLTFLVLFCFFFGGRIGEGHNYLANIIPFEKLFKTQLIISVFCPHVAKDQNLSTFWNIPVLSGLLRTIAEFVHLSSES